MKKLIAGLALFTAFTCQAETVRSFMTGNSFLQLPIDSQHGYVMGIFDAGIHGCVPFDVKSNQLWAVMTAYLYKHPESWHIAASEIYFLAIRESFGAYPNCK